MAKVVNDEKDLKDFTADLLGMLKARGYDVEIKVYDWNDEAIRYTMVLNEPSAYAKMFKIPNLIFDNLDVEASELTDMSGCYTDWFLVVPNKM